MQVVERVLHDLAPFSAARSLQSLVLNHVVTVLCGCRSQLASGVLQCHLATESLPDGYKPASHIYAQVALVGSSGPEAAISKLAMRQDLIQVMSLLARPCGSDSV